MPSYELRHDSLAKKIYANISQQDKELLHLQKDFEQQYEKYLSDPNYLLSIQDVSYFTKNLDRLNLSNNQLKFYQKSKTKREYQFYIRIGVFIIIAAISAIIASAIANKNVTDSKIKLSNLEGKIDSVGKQYKNELNSLDSLKTKLKGLVNVKEQLEMDKFNAQNDKNNFLEIIKKSKSDLENLHSKHKEEETKYKTSIEDLMCKFDNTQNNINTQIQDKDMQIKKLNKEFLEINTIGGFYIIDTVNTIEKQKLVSKWIDPTQSIQDLAMKYKFPEELLEKEPKMMNDIFKLRKSQTIDRLYIIYLLNKFYNTDEITNKATIITIKASLASEINEYKININNKIKKEKQFNSDSLKYYLIQNKDLNNAIHLMEIARQFKYAKKYNDAYIVMLLAYNCMNLDLVDDDTKSAICGSLSFYSIFINKADEAIKFSKEGISLDSKKYYILTNMGHGYLLKGNFDKAKSVYESIPEYSNIQTVNSALLEDFADFEAAGVILPRVEEMKKYIISIKKRKDAR